MAREWSFDEIYDVSKSYQAACALVAAAELDVFTVLADGPLNVEDMAARLGVDRRGLAMLLDALVALELLDKEGFGYAAPASLLDLLGREGAGSILAMTRHQATCLRRWSELARAIHSGKPIARPISIRGKAADEVAFIMAMDNLAQRTAPALVAELNLEPFGHLLDLGGASGTWTIAFLQRYPDAGATLFDLPHVLPLAEERLDAAGLRDRVTLAGGNFLADPLPAGADLAWVSAIVHQNSRAQNRQMFSSLRSAMEPGARVLIRDVLMDESRSTPPRGALFAIHMLVATEGGGTFTFNELQEDLQAAGFTDAVILRRDEGMDSVMQAKAI